MSHVTDETPASPERARAAASPDVPSAPYPARGWRFAVAGVIVVALVVLDQLVKAWARTALASGPQPLIPGVLRLQLVHNTGAAFSIGEGMGSSFVLLAIAVTIAVAVYLVRAPHLSRVEVVGLALVVGGAIGNAIDRAVLGSVTDFFATEFIDFPVFNVADIGITVGVAVALIGFICLSPANKVDATAELNRRGGRS